MSTKLFSIGHSNASIEKFLTLLKQHEITLLADVRSQPYSRYNPHFGREALKQAVMAESINYVFLGDRIGGKPADASLLLPNGKVDYDKLAATEVFQNGIGQLLELAETNKVSFMCAEADFRHCHRYWLITRTLVERGIEVQHILHTGEVVGS
ncbi:MAG: DUF488 domain-containing protein, partial [Acidobacteria bacterium]|nr:DUF488 domain-containing protein [Acidobacteriota bacterium]